MHIYICDIYIYWFGGLDELTVANLRYRPYIAYYFFVSFSSFIRDERFEKTMRFDSTKKVSSFVKKKRKTQSINCLELTASVPTEHFLKDKISRGVSEPSKAWFGRFLDETTMQRLQRNIIEYIDWKKEKKKRNLHAVQSRVLSRDVGEKVLSAYNYICISIRIIKDSSHLVV